MHIQTRGLTGMVRLVSHFGMAALLFSLIGLSAMAHSAPVAVEKIFVADFEEQPVDVYSRIEFVGDRTQLFSGSGESRTASVRVYEVDGSLVVNPDIDWTCGDGTLLSVSGSAPGQAQLSSLGTWDGTVNFEAAYPPLGFGITAQATMVDPAPQTMLIPSSWVGEALGDRFAERILVLEPNTRTADEETVDWES